MKITPELFTSRLREALGDRLISVVLYGSAAGKDFIERTSDYNMLLLARAWDPPAMNDIRQVAGEWIQAGNPPPLTFTPERLSRACDVFPLEMLDILEAHQILHGIDPLKGLHPSRIHLRHQVEFELRSKLLHLRSSYLALTSPEADLADLLAVSLVPFLSVLRGALRLLEKEGAPIPADKLEATRRLASRLGISADVFEELQRIRTASGTGNNIDAEDLFRRYLETIETILDAIDADHFSPT